MSIKFKSEHLWICIMTAVGFCSLIYELTLAQLLTGLLGGAMSRFATTLGVYIVGMGIGSVSFKGEDNESDALSFLITELTLAAFGLAAPFLSVIFYWLSLRFFSSTDEQTFFVLICTHLIIFVVGFLSGRELPIFSSIVSRSRSGADSHVLAADYVGMFLASIAFPFVLYPLAGLVASFAIATLLNLSAALATLYLINRPKFRIIKAALISFVLVNLVVLFYSTNFQEWLSKLYAST